MVFFNIPPYTSLAAFIDNVSIFARARHYKYGLPRQSKDGGVDLNHVAYLLDEIDRLRPNRCVTELQTFHPDLDKITKNLITKTP